MKRYIIYSLVIAVCALGAGASRVHAAGLSPAQIDSIISLLDSFNADQAPITSVRASLGASVSEAVVPAAAGKKAGAGCYAFKSDLVVGSKGKDVAELVKILKKEGFLGTAKHGDVFDGVLVSAVKKLQSRHNIKQTGQAGPSTRTKLGSLSGC